MPNLKRPRETEHSMLAQMLAIRLQQLETLSGNADAFIAKLGLGKGTYFDLVRGRGNPTLRTIERVAARLDQSLFELIGFSDADVRRAATRIGVDHDELQDALAERKAADEKIAAALTPLK